jgi:putative membrane protein
MRNQLMMFLVRVLINTLALYVCVNLFGEYSGRMMDFLVAGLILSLINATIKPFITILSLPFILVTLGLFTIIVNGFMVYIAIALAPGLTMGFWGAVWSGIIVSLANYSINVVLGSNRGGEALA